MSDSLNNAAATVIKERIRAIMLSERSPAEKERLVLALGHGDPASQAAIVEELVRLCLELESGNPDP